MIKRAAFEENTHAAVHIVSDAQKEAVLIAQAAKNEARATLADAEALAKKEHANILAAAAMEAQQIKTKALADVDNERQALYSELRDKVLSIALHANEKLFGKSEANAEFIRQSMKEE